MSEFRSEMWLAHPRDRVFGFFADASNLARITPPWLEFRVRTRAPIAMHEGTLIDYRLRVRGIPIGWRTRIAVWEPPVRFVDEQLRGPYRRWVHEHSFEEREGGTLCRDQVDYAVLGGWLVDRLLVRRAVEAIFAYRHQQLERLMGTEAKR